MQQSSDSTIRIFLSGDVMTGRGIDQTLPNAGDPVLHEPVVRDAREYVALAEKENGPLPKVTDHAYIWGDALAKLDSFSPDLRLINLETAITQSDDFWQGKGIHYRMHPENVRCLTAAEIDCCALANNHVLDWGYAGLKETLRTLQKAGIEYAGAGLNQKEAEEPAILDLPQNGRILIFSIGMESSGIPSEWAASQEKPGVALLEEVSDSRLREIRKRALSEKQKGDIVIFSLHWGGNWGYEVPGRQQTLAHRLIDEAGGDIIHGHSSHHPKGIEVHNDRLILYGCGDLINDYEGIGGNEAYRPDLSLLYFASFNSAGGELVGLQMEPMQMRKLRLNNASQRDAEWLAERLSREGDKFGTSVGLSREGTLKLQWK